MALQNRRHLANMADQRVIRALPGALTLGFVKFPAYPLTPSLKPCCPIVSPAPRLLGTDEDSRLLLGKSFDSVLRNRRPLTVTAVSERVKAAKRKLKEQMRKDALAAKYAKQPPKEREVFNVTQAFVNALNVRKIRVTLLRRLSGASIKLQDGKMFITGTDSQRQAAKIIADNWMKNVDEERFEIDQDWHSLLIGYKGYTVRLIEQRTSSHVRFSLTPYPCMVVCGTPSQRAAAYKFALEILEERKTHETKYPIEDAHDNACIKTLFANNCSLLYRIEEQSGAKIRFDINGPERTMYATGTPPQRRNASLLVKQYLANVSTTLAEEEFLLPERYKNTLISVRGSVLRAIEFESGATISFSRLPSPRMTAKGLPHHRISAYELVLHRLEQDSNDRSWKSRAKLFSVYTIEEVQKRRSNSDVADSQDVVVAGINSQNAEEFSSAETSDQSTTTAVDAGRNQDILLNATGGEMKESESDSGPDTKQMRHFRKDPEIQSLSEIEVDGGDDGASSEVDGDDGTISEVDGDDGTISEVDGDDGTISEVDGGDGTGRAAKHERDATLDGTNARVQHEGDADDVRAPAHGSKDSRTLARNRQGNGAKVGQSAEFAESVVLGTDKDMDFAGKDTAKETVANQRKIDTVQDGGDIVQESTDIAQDGGYIMQDGGDIVQKGTDIVQKGMDIVQHGGDIVQDGGDIVQDGGDIVQDGGDIVQDGGDIVQDGADIVHKRTDAEQNPISMDITHAEGSTGQGAEDARHIQEGLYQRDSVDTFVLTDYQTHVLVKSLVLRHIENDTHTAIAFRRTYTLEDVHNTSENLNAHLENVCMEDTSRYVTANDVNDAHKKDTNLDDSHDDLKEGDTYKYKYKGRCRQQRVVRISGSCRADRLRAWDILQDILGQHESTVNISGVIITDALTTVYTFEEAQLRRFNETLRIDAERYLVDGDLVGAVIGKDGLVIKRIQEVSGAQVKVRVSMCICACVCVCVCVCGRMDR